MKKLFILVTSILAISCANKDEKPSLQEYFVKSAEDKSFINLDVSSSIFNINEKSLSASEKKALESFDKVNILAFKKDDKNAASYSNEVKEVKEILKDSTYQPLIKLNGKDQSASIMLVGDEKNIDELILFGNQSKLGFTVIRILGDNMKPENAIEFLNILKKSDVDVEQLKPVLNFLGDKKK
jgi:Domain of unknown function (DUF4252)